MICGVLGDCGPVAQMPATPTCSPELVDNKIRLAKSGILLKDITGGMQRAYQIAQYRGGGDSLWKSIFDMGEVSLYLFGFPIGGGEGIGIVIPMGAINFARPM